MEEGRIGNNRPGRFHGHNNSAGAISRTTVDILGSRSAIGVEFNLQFRNAGFCELIVAGDGPSQEYRLVAFNSIPHLDTPERRNAITFA